MANSSFFRMFLVVAMMSVGLCSCDQQPAQDYVLTGTLSLNPKFSELDRQRLAAPARQPRTRVLIMTMRTSPDVGDVVLQRRWSNPRLPLEYGLGQNLGQRFKSAYPKLYVTAYLRDETGAEYVGWTPTSVAPGIYHSKMRLNHLIAQVDHNDPLTPKGGWWSPSIAEEAAPPGEQDQDPGPMVFSGSVDVAPELRRAFSNLSVQVLARARPRGAPELIATYVRPVFPFKFSLHQNQRVMGDPEPILNGKFVTAILVGSSIDSKGDRIEVSTETAMKPGTDGIKLVFDTAEAKNLQAMLRSKMKASSRPSSRPSSQPSGNTVKKSGKAGLLARGIVTLPDGGKIPPKAILWLSVRSAGADKLLMFKRVIDPKFPHRFEYFDNENEFGQAPPVPEKFHIRAILTATDPSGKAPGDFKATSQELVQGQQSVVLTLIENK